MIQQQRTTSEINRYFERRRAISRSEGSFKRRHKEPNDDILSRILFNTIQFFVSMYEERIFREEVFFFCVEKRKRDGSMIDCIVQYYNSTS